MGKISKEVMKKHSKAMEILQQEELSYYDKEFVYKHYYEGATNMNKLMSAHFTPFQIARSIEQNSGRASFVDLCAGIGMLSYARVRALELHYETKWIGICVEASLEYYTVGKKLLPECHWIHGSIFDNDVIEQIKALMKGVDFSILSNPPYGKQVKGKHDAMHYTGSEFEYKAIEIGAMLGASDGVFLIPDESTPFRITSTYNDFDKKYKSKKYLKFVEETEIEISPNNGYHTEICEDDWGGWKDVSISTQIAFVDYEELDYKPKVEQIIEDPNQIKLF